MNLAQTEYYSMNGSYYPPSGSSNSSTTTCTPDDTTSSDIEKVLLGDGSKGPDIITEDLNYHVCIWRKDDQYGLIAEEDTSSKACKITMSNMGTVNREQHC